MTAVWIVATAAVRPSPGVRTLLTDPEVRARHYRQAIGHWRHVSARVGASLAVVETTGADPATLVDPGPVTVTSFAPAPELVGRGKGAIEAAAIEHVVSVLGIPEDDTICKITGRLVVENATDLVRPVGENSAIVRRTLDRRYCDTRFFLTSGGLWRGRLSGMGRDVDDHAGRYLEHVVAHRLAVAEYESGTVVGRFAAPPVFRGVSGTSGARYGSPLSRVCSPVRARAESVLAQLAAKQV